MKDEPMYSGRGFTLIELVLVIMLVGILSAVALPRVISNNSTDSVVTRDALVSRLRLVQTMNMNEPSGQRTHLALNNSAFAHITELVSNSVWSTDLSNHNKSWRRIYDIKSPVSLNSLTTFSIAFDRLGKPQAYNAAGNEINACEDGCNIQTGYGQTVRIEQEGYIHGQ